MTATLSFLVELQLRYVMLGRKSLEQQSFWVAYPSVLLWAVILSLISVACTFKLSSYAKGSGTPEIKTILSGTTLSGPLSLRCFFAKFIGLICGISLFYIFLSLFGQ